MAEDANTNALTPVLTTSIEIKRTPTTDPPKTSFPYPEDKGTTTAAPRAGSDVSTLVEPEDAVKEAARKRSASDADTSIQRPGLPQKFGTEAPPVVAPRPLITNIDRHSTSARLGGTAPFPDFHDSDSEFDFSSDNDAPGPIGSNKEKPGPGHSDLTPAELNRVRMRPWPRHRKENRLHVGNENFSTRGKIAKDGRLNIKISEGANTGYLAKTLGHALETHLHPHARQAKHDAHDLKAQYRDNEKVDKIPRMNIVIMVIGSRGDIQPFLKIGKILQDKYGHRVRIATHPAFRKFVQEDIGLEFFSIGGDPSELMSFMVKNPGLLPSFETLTSGDVGKRRDEMFEMFQGFWRACINTTDDEKDVANLQMLGNRNPFIADAIIANPPSFAHYHCAEKLGVPLHLVFTFPYSPTKAFPHPLANIKASNVDREYTNYMSYPLVDLMTWQGLGDLVNRFRVETLGLEPVSTLWAPGQLTRLRVPMTYLWSPGLVPKPADWGPEIDIAGYVFLDLASSFKPPEDLANFLKRTDDDKRSIIYIGFGSISGIDDPKAFCELIFEAVEEAGVKAVVSRGWGGMGDGMDVPDGVFLVDNVPHDWLFPQLDAVVHHGGAGTTAAGLRFGKPTMIVPFFGDQPFWAAMIVRAGAGAKEVFPLKKLTVERFATGITQCLEPSAKEAAEAIAKSIELEGDGAENAVKSFHSKLPLTGNPNMRCGVFEDRVAVWKIKHTGLRLSALAAELLVENKQLSWIDLDLCHHRKWVDFQGPGEPITGAGGVVVSAFQEAFHGITSIHENAKIDFQKIEKRKQKKQRKKFADAITTPGVIAGHIRTGKDLRKLVAPEMKATVNFPGEAEPLRLPHISDDEEDRDPTRPIANRTVTTSTMPDATPVLLVKDVGKGVGHSFKAIFTLPGDMLNAITLGFRNAPRLYGDRTVRPPPQNIDGLRQGIKTAGKELWFGVYDGTTGLIRIPYHDMGHDGITGLPKGCARGVGGLVLKPVAGILGVVNYTNRGVLAHLRRRFRDTQKTERWIRRARLLQGAGEIRDMRAAEDKRKQEAAVNRAVGVVLGSELEAARSRALTRWTSNDRRELEEAKQRARKGTLSIPSGLGVPTRRLTKSDKQKSATA